jgi:hypothetical protein
VRFGRSLGVRNSSSRTDEFYRPDSEGLGIVVEADVGHPVETELWAVGWKVFEDEPVLTSESNRSLAEGDESTERPGRWPGQALRVEWLCDMTGQEGDLGPPWQTEQGTVNSAGAS